MQRWRNGKKIFDSEDDAVVEAEDEDAPSEAEISMSAIEQTLKDINDFDTLCISVSSTSSRAYNLLMHEIQDLPDFEYCGNLFEVFTWTYSKQGYEYWFSIYEKLVKINEQPPVEEWKDR